MAITAKMSGSLFHKAISFGLFVGSALIAVALTLGFFGAWHPAFDSFAHFRVLLGVLLASAAPLLLLTAHRVHALAALLLGLGAIGTTLPPGSLPGPGSVRAALPPEANQPIYKLLQLNLRYNNPTPEQVLSLIGRVRPDVVTLDEVSTMWEGKLALLKAAYPNQINCRVRRFGVALLSRRPFSPGAEPKCFDRGSLAIAQVNLGGVSVEVAAIHLAWPWPFEQDWQLGNLAEPLGGLGETAILAGDFNATPWSHTAARVAKMGGLTPVAGIGPTWLALALPRELRPAGLPIDHVMAKGELDVRSTRLLEPVGSDHWPVLVEFSLRPGQSEPPATATAMRSN